MPQRASKTPADSYLVELAPAALKVFTSFPAPDRDHVRAALLHLAARVSRPAGRGTKSIKSIHGARDDFWRLRVGDYRVMFDVVRTDAVILVLGIVNRRDLESWLRRR